MGDIAKSPVGSTVDALTASGRRSNAKEELLGQILESIENNRYRVTFTYRVTRDLSSKALKKASASEVSMFHVWINNLVYTSTSIEDVHDHDLNFEFSSIDLSFQVDNDDDMIDHQVFEDNKNNQDIASIPTTDNLNININTNKSKPSKAKRKKLHSSTTIMSNNPVANHIPANQLANNNTKTNNATMLDDVYEL